MNNRTLRRRDAARKERFRELRDTTKANQVKLIESEVPKEYWQQFNGFGWLESTGEFRNGEPVYTFSQECTDRMYRVFHILATKPLPECGPAIAGELGVEWRPDEL